MSAFINGLWSNSLDRLNFAEYFNFESNPFFWLDILALIFIVWLIYRFVHQTRGERIIWGIVILAAAWLAASALQLKILQVLLQLAFASLFIAIPVVFQPELRAGLERLGRSTRLVTDWRKLTQPELEYVLTEVLKAVRLLAKNRFGAIIVLTRSAGLQEFIDEAEPIYARIGARLLTSIFYPRNPLHDGAVIISGNRIVAARATLPLSEESDLTIGTRHRAALGITEQSDAISVAVSEETGKVSLAYDGKLIKRIRYDKLAAELKKLLTKSSVSNWKIS